MQTKRHLVAAPALAVVLVLAGQSGAAASPSPSPIGSQRDGARARKAALAQRIDALKASDSQLEQAVEAMGTMVGIQQARSDAAQQALRAAQAQQQAAARALQQAEHELGSLRSAMAGRAVQAYVHPVADALPTVASVDDLVETSRRAALLNQLSGRDGDGVDRLRATARDVADQRRVAARAQELAGQRRRLEDQALGELRRALSDKQRLKGALEGRIKEFQREADAVAAQEASLSALIRSRETAPPGPRAVGAVSAAGLIWPVRGVLSSPFGMRWGRLHAGIDISVPIGTPIHAAKAGTVIFSGQMSGYGGVVVIDHGGGFSTLYAHQSRPASSEGQAVSQGQVIGYSGNTGHSTGPHLHFETRVNGTPVNPMQFLR